MNTKHKHQHKTLNDNAKTNTKHERQQKHITMNVNINMFMFSNVHAYLYAYVYVNTPAQRRALMPRNFGALTAPLERIIARWFVCVCVVALALDELDLSTY